MCTFSCDSVAVMIYIRATFDEHRHWKVCDERRSRSSSLVQLEPFPFTVIVSWRPMWNGNHHNEQYCTYFDRKSFKTNEGWLSCGDAHSRHTETDHQDFEKNDGWFGVLRRFQHFQLYQGLSSVSYQYYYWSIYSDTG